MLKLLEDVLREKTKDTQSEILLAQWNYDKKVIPSALQAVSNLFPHYSLHDESHSITIINNIVRVLGKENITNLSSIDIWLILEAAYSHDIGMVVSSEELVRALNSQHFLDFFNELLQDKKNGLYEFANQFKIIDNKIRQKSDILNIELNDAIKFILAEYFRRTHAERSQDIINDPAKELSLLSPRSVIPPRIFKMLANICSSHTKDFRDVLALPFCQVGIDLEDAHPRFIACMLRVGDLLDLDNNRFSEVMLRTLTKVPIDTLNHKAKHLSIESFRVDKNVIEITANCKDYDTANITQHWFNYLNSEISNQTINWNNIVPFKELGYLPTIGSLKVELSNYDFIDGKNKPKFSVDTDKALSLLQGAGIYDGAHQCIREILQNAVDSTLIRIWLEHGNNENFAVPSSKEFLSIIGNYPIEVNITDKGTELGWKNWEIIIEDKGTGISTHDLKFLMSTGSSSKNIEKHNIIARMPAWMRPSGTFGIGFQSIFMLTDMVTIETKSFFTEEFQIIELNSPNSDKDGDILIQRKKTSHVVKPGAKFIISHKTKAIPDRYSIKTDHENASRIAHNFDPFSHKSLDIELGKILDEVLEFSEKSYFPVSLTVESNPLETKNQRPKKFDYFDDATGLELKISCQNTKFGGRCFTYYKNQKAENNVSITFLDIEVNIHKEKASEVLTLNRNKIKGEFYGVFLNELFVSLFKIIIKNFDEIFTSNEGKAIGSMFLNYYTDETLKDYDIKIFNQWQDFTIIVGKSEMPMINILNSATKITVMYDFNMNPGRTNDKYTFNDNELFLELDGGSSYNYTSFFLNQVQELFKCVSLGSEENNKVSIVYTKGEQKSIVTKEDMEKIIQGLLTNPSSARAIIPCIEEFSALRLADDCREPYVYHFYFNHSFNIPYPKMLSPFVRKEHQKWEKSINVVLNEKVINWVFDNRFSLKTTKKDIVEGYEKFLTMFPIDNGIAQ
jgi:hypothetical protein